MKSVTKKQVLLLAMLLGWPEGTLAETANVPRDLDELKFTRTRELGLAPTPGWHEREIVYPQGVGRPDVFVTLDQHLFPLVRQPIAAYAVQTRLSIDLLEGTCGISAGMLANKQADVGGFCCPPSRFDRLPGLRFHTFGLMPNALIVHRDNPVNNVSLEEARQLFSGEIDLWSGLSDPAAAEMDRAVQPITRLHCKARPGHWRIIGASEDDFSPMIHDVSTIPDMIDTVAGHPDAIGWVAMGKLGSGSHRDKVKLLTLNGVHPTDRARIAAGRYPFYKVLNFTTWSGPAANPAAEAMVRDLVAHAQTHCRDTPAVPVGDLRAQGWRFHEQELIGEPGP